MIDITMTATLRPKLVAQTLDSFCRNIFTDRNNYRLIVNIDPVGEKVKSTRVIEVCHQCFKNVVYNVPASPSFPVAVVWCWSRVESDYVFHLEDDWLSVARVDINDMIRILRDDETLACLRLSKYDIPKPHTVKLWGVHYTYSGPNYFSTSSNNQFGLNPVLIKKKFIKEAIPLMSLHSNPEKQFRPSKNDRMNRLINSWRYGLYGVPGARAYVLDNGTTWRQNNNFKKPSGSFLVWEKAR